MSEFNFDDAIDDLIAEAANPAGEWQTEADKRNRICDEIQKLRDQRSDANKRAEEAEKKLMDERYGAKKAPDGDYGQLARAYTAVNGQKADGQRASLLADAIISDWLQLNETLQTERKALGEEREAVKVLAKQIATIVISWGPKCIIKDEVHMAVVEMIVRVGQDPTAKAAIDAARRGE